MQNGASLAGSQSQPEDGPSEQGTSQLSPFYSHNVHERRAGSPAYISAKY